MRLINRLPVRADSIRSRLPFWIAMAGFIGTLCFYFPGDMSDPDSVDQFQQSLRFRFNDWHPPIMALLWSVFNHLWKGPHLMLLLQLALYWASVFFLLDSLIKRVAPGRAILIVFLACAPFTLVFLGELVKDVQLVGAWSFVASYVYWRHARGHKLNIAETLGLLVLVLYGGLLRHNSGLIAGPLVLYLLTGGPFLQRVIRTLAVYILVALAIIGVGKTLNAVLNVEKSLAIRALLTFDIVGVSSHSDVNQLPLTLSEKEYAQVMGCYDGASQEPFIWGECRFLWHKLDTVGATNESMLREWAGVLIRFPLSYVMHRALFMKNFVLKRKHETLTHFVVSIFSRTITWIAALGILVYFLVSRRMAAAARAFVVTELVVSALYIMTFVPFGVSWGFRYIYPVVVGVSFGACVLIGKSKPLVRCH